MGGSETKEPVAMEQMRITDRLPAPREQLVERGRAALARIGEIAQRQVPLAEYFPMQLSLERLICDQLAIGVDKLEKEVKALELLGSMGRYGITMRDKLLMHMTALHKIAEAPAHQLDRAMTWAAFRAVVAKQVSLNAQKRTVPEDGWTGGERTMSLEELAAAVVIERQSAAKKDKRTPYYIMNVGHPAVEAAYTRWRKENTRAGCPPGDAERTCFELEQLNEECLARLEAHFKLVEGVKKMSEGGPCPYEK